MDEHGALRKGNGWSKSRLRLNTRKKEGIGHRKRGMSRSVDNAIQGDPLNTTVSQSVDTVNPEITDTTSQYAGEAMVSSEGEWVAQSRNEGSSGEAVSLSEIVVTIAHEPEHWFDKRYSPAEIKGKALRKSALRKN